jgi:hypothetical protein
LRTSEGWIEGDGFEYITGKHLPGSSTRRWEAEDVKELVMATTFLGSLRHVLGKIGAAFPILTSRHISQERATS